MEDESVNTLFSKWLEANKVEDYLDPESQYDYYGAFREGVAPDELGHWPDTYKLPGHATFSTESKYYRPGMKAGYWKNDEYVPLAEGEEPPIEPEALGTTGGASIIDFGRTLQRLAGGPQALPEALKSGSEQILGGMREGGAFGPGKTIAALMTRPEFLSALTKVHGQNWLSEIFGSRSLPPWIRNIVGRVPDAQIDRLKALDTLKAGREKYGEQIKQGARGAFAGPATGHAKKQMFLERSSPEDFGHEFWHELEDEIENMPNKKEIYGSMNKEYADFLVDHGQQFLRLEDALETGMFNASEMYAAAYGAFLAKPDLFKQFPKGTQDLIKKLYKQQVGIKASWSK